VQTIPSLVYQVFSREMDKDMVILLAARASRVENQDAIDMAIITMLADSKEVLNFFNGLYTFRMVHGFCLFRLSKRVMLP
jgi:hypothetical protein